MKKAEREVAEKFTALVHELYEDNFPKRRSPQVEIKFSNHLSTYNANIRYVPQLCKYQIKMHKNWIDSDEMIVRGLLEFLIFRVNNIKKKTLYTDMYDTFILNAHTSIEKNKIDPVLQTFFEQNNNELLSNEIEQTNLVWGQKSIRTLGTYNYQNDTITISSALKNAPEHLIRFVVYHEMLHKKHKFTKGKVNTLHHSPAFRKEEKLFPNFESIDKELSKFLRKKKFFGLW